MALHTRLARGGQHQSLTKLAGDTLPEKSY